MNIEKYLADLLEETGMLESRARCELAAKELVAKGVRVPTAKQEMEAVERSNDVRTVQAVDRLRELERYLFAPTEAVDLAVTALYALLRERAYLIDCLKHVDTNCDYCNNNPPEDCFCECETCDINCPCKFCTKDGEVFVFRGVPQDWETE